MPDLSFAELLDSLPEGWLVEPAPPGSDAARVADIVLDSRQARPGSLFVALAGGSTDGHRFIADAVGRGAVAVVGTQLVPGLSVPYARVRDGRQALAGLAAALEGYPARRLWVTGVTGTDGKTTTSSLIYQMLKTAGLPAGLISTVSAAIGEENLDTGFHVTTPEAVDVQRYLRRMVDAGLTHAVLETTSHGLAQQRVGSCEFDVAVVTNITHEHLDFHGSFEAYREAKAGLFRALAELRHKSFSGSPLAVLNRDDDSYEYLATITAEPEAQHAGVRVISYGLSPQADVRAEDIQVRAQGLRFQVSGPGFSINVETPMLGNFNVSNSLAAICAAVLGLGISPEAARDGIAAMPGIPGRLERIELGADFLTYVDFAHTPNAMRAALQTARELLAQRARPGRVIAVFGSAGLRDRQKRRLMAQEAARLADISVFTAEDPRTEPLGAILEEMSHGAHLQGGVEGKTFWRVPDRRDALRFALRLAQPGDIVLALGKGHEQSMCFGEIEYAWDDRTALRAALCELLGLPGPEMPYLPMPTD